MINAIVYHTDDQSMNSNCIKVIKDIKHVEVHKLSYGKDMGRISIYYIEGSDPCDYSHEFELYYPGNLTKDLILQINNKISEQIYTCLKNRADDCYAHIDLAQITEKVIKEVEDEI